MPQLRQRRAETPPADSAEPATAVQLAFLSYFGIAAPANLLKDAAEWLITKAKEDPHSVKRLEMWNVDRLLLHPELFAAEAQAKKEDRAQFFFDLCQTAGSDYFTGVTKAHCQVLVEFLDVKFPRWDANEAEATERYFFPAMAEKFPAARDKAWRGRHPLWRGTGRPRRRRRRRAPRNWSRRPIHRCARSCGGWFSGLCVLGVLYGVHRVLHSEHPTSNTPHRIIH
ncbi:MAG: hypothetical protein WDN28_32060 [Chthoniobacter sp.]